MRKRISQLIVFLTSAFLVLLSILFALSQNQYKPDVRTPKDKNTIIAIYCKMSVHSTLAMGLLQQLGYKNAITIDESRFFLNFH